MGVADGVAGGSVGVGDAAPDTAGPGPAVVGDGDGLVADGVGEWFVCRGVGVGLAVCVGAGVAAGVVSAAADAVSTGAGRTYSQRANTARNSPISTRVEVRGRLP